MMQSYDWSSDSPSSCSTVVLILKACREAGNNGIVWVKQEARVWFHLVHLYMENVPLLHNLSPLLVHCKSDSEGRCERHPILWLWNAPGLRHDRALSDMVQSGWAWGALSVYFELSP